MGRTSNDLPLHTSRALISTQYFYEIVVMVTEKLLQFISSKIMIIQEEKSEPGMHGVDGNAGVKVGRVHFKKI